MESGAGTKSTPEPMRAEQAQCDSPLVASNVQRSLCFRRFRRIIFASFRRASPAASARASCSLSARLILVFTWILTLTWILDPSWILILIRILIFVWVLINNCIIAWVLRLGLPPWVARLCFLPHFPLFSSLPLFSSSTLFFLFFLPRVIGRRAGEINPRRQLDSLEPKWFWLRLYQPPGRGRPWVIKRVARSA